MIKEEFLKQVSEWREKWNDYFEHNNEMVRGWQLHHEVIMTCDTEGCRNEGKFWKDTVSEQLDGVYRVECGRCHHPIEYMDPMLDDDPDFLLNTRMLDGSSWMLNPGGTDPDD